MPEERQMTFSKFLDIIDSHPRTSPAGVFYIQKQNSNMTDEFKELMDDVDQEIAWASEALSKI